MLSKEILLLAEDCLTYRLTQKESIEYMSKRLNRPVSISTYNRAKNIVESDESLNHYFNHYTRIGFISDHRKRKNEIESILTHLMRKWVTYAQSNNPDIHRLVRLADAVVNANKRAEEISLSNPVISKIKMEIDNGSKQTSEEGTGSNIIPEARSQFKF